VQPPFRFSGEEQLSTPRGIYTIIFSFWRIKMKSTDNKFYTYVYLDPRKKGRYAYPNLSMSFLYEPIYVGKGCLNKSGTDRIDSHIKDSYTVFDKGNQLKFNKIRKIIKEANQPPITLKVKENITEKQAHNLESKLIDTIGRYDLKQGPLTNLTDGGEGTVGWKPSGEIRSNMSKGQLGRKHTSKTKKIMRENSLKNNQYQHLKKWRQNATEEEIGAWKDKHRGERNGFYGRKWSDADKNIMRKRMLGKYSGSKNHASKLYILKSPSNNTYILLGTFKRFCTVNKLSEYTLRRNVNMGKIKSRKSTCTVNGWSLIDIEAENSPSSIEVFSLIFNPTTKIITSIDT
jgi:hypothetical protein